MRQNGKPKRDEYMRQIIDTKGVLNRLAINADETERDIIEEFEENQWESREAIKFAGMQPSRSAAGPGTGCMFCTGSSCKRPQSGSLRKKLLLATG